MATLHPFTALRPVPEKVEEIASVPYDVVSSEEARALAEGKPLSFLHIIRPEIDLPPDTDEHADSVYAKGAENLRAYAESDYSLQEAAPALYVYQLVMDGQAQTGLFGCVAVGEYDGGTIVRHENTRPVKEDDRTRHILEQRAHAEPVMLTFRDDADVQRLIDQTAEGEPLYDFEAEDGIRHTLWKANEPTALVEAFGSVPLIYIADGHHRCKAASRAAEELNQVGKHVNPEVDFFPAVLFPVSQMRILPYNRTVRSLPTSPAAFLEKLKSRFDVRPGAAPVPGRAGQISVYLEGKWYGITLPPSEQDTVAAGLDVARLGEHLLEPLLGIADPRTDPNLDFVGGIRGTEALEQRVDSGQAQMGISMHPTSVEELLDVSDASELMPPKSTWFEPKLRSGLLVHRF